MLLVWEHLIHIYRLFYKRQPYVAIFYPTTGAFCLRPYNPKKMIDSVFQYFLFQRFHHLSLRQVTGRKTYTHPQKLVQVSLLCFHLKEAAASFNVCGLFAFNQDGTGLTRSLLVIFGLAKIWINAKVVSCITVALLIEYPQYALFKTVLMCS